MKEALLRDSLTILNDSIVHLNQIIRAMSPIEHFNLWPNIITICLALLAAFIALHQVRSNVVSSSRIRKIENLRKIISQYCVEILNTAVIRRNIVTAVKLGKTAAEKTKILNESLSDYLKSHSKSDSLGKQVILHLDSSNKVHCEIERLIKINIEFIDDHKMQKFEELDAQVIKNNLELVIELAKKAIEDEFRKAKKIFQI